MSNAAGRDISVLVVIPGHQGSHHAEPGHTSGAIPGVAHASGAFGVAAESSWGLSIATANYARFSLS